jgi:hypothetical protein
MPPISKENGPSRGHSCAGSQYSWWRGLTITTQSAWRWRQRISEPLFSNGSRAQLERTHLLPAFMQRRCAERKRQGKSNASAGRLKCPRTFRAPLPRHSPRPKLSISISVCNATVTRQRLAGSPCPAHHPSIQKNNIMGGAPACPHCHAAIFLRSRDRLLPL